MESDELHHCSTAGPVEVDLVLQSGRSSSDGFGEKDCDFLLPLRAGVGHTGGTGHPFAALSASSAPVLSPSPPASRHKVPGLPPPSQPEEEHYLPCFKGSISGTASPLAPFTGGFS